MSSDAAPTTPAADDRVPAPRSGTGPVAVPDPGPDPGEAAPDAVDDATEQPDDGADAPEVPEVPEVPEAAGDAAEAEPDGGRLTARIVEARARLAPEPLAIPAPRSPEGVVPPPTLGRGVAPAAGLVEALDELRGEIARLEGAPDGPERRALARVLELASTGIPDAGWSRAERIDAEALAGAADLAGTLHASAATLLERLDAEERAASAVEIDAVVTALQVARMVLDLESFARHGRQ